MDLITKKYVYLGVEHVAHFREMTGRQQIEMSRGLRQTIRSSSDTEIEVDLSTEGERGHRLVLMTLVDENGSPVYSSLQKLQDEKASKLAKLVALAREAASEFAKQAEDLGNA